MICNEVVLKLFGILGSNDYDLLIILLRVKCPISVNYCCYRSAYLNIFVDAVHSWKFLTGYLQQFTTLLKLEVM
jgi:hypothetical protein